MQYALLIYETPADFARRQQAGDDATYFGAWRGAYYKAVVEAGIYAGVVPLDAPETGTTVRRRDGKPLVQDGPYASSKEQLGGFMLLELLSLDAAWNGRRRCPAALIWRCGNPTGRFQFQRRLESEDQRDKLRTAPSRRQRVNRTGVSSRCWRRVPATGGAEDALADALLAALNTWARDGIPKNPQAWLLTAARNRLLDHARHLEVRERSASTKCWRTSSMRPGPRRAARRASQAVVGLRTPCHRS